MIGSKMLKIFSLAMISTVLFTTSVFASGNVSKTKDNYYNKISKIYSNKSSQKEKIDYINSRNTKKNTNKITISELNLYEKIDKQNGVSHKQKNSMVKKYVDSINELGTKNTSELKKDGYSDTRIKLIKEANSLISTTRNQTETSSLNNILVGVGSTVTVMSSLDGYYHDTAYTATSGKFKTLIFVEYNWKWSEAPIIKDTDGFATGFNSNNNLQLYYTNDGIGYYNEIDNSLYGDVDYSAKASNSENASKNGIYFSFPVETGSNYKKKTGLDGYSMNVLVNNDSYVDEFDINALYAHSLDTTIPQFSINNTGVTVNSGSTLYNLSTHYKYSDFIPGNL